MIYGKTMTPPTLSPFDSSSIGKEEEELNEVLEMLHMAEERPLDKCCYLDCVLE